MKNPEPGALVVSIAMVEIKNTKVAWKNHVKSAEKAAGHRNYLMQTVA